jgi:phosphate transport system substrate-binding protein
MNNFRSVARVSMALIAMATATWGVSTTETHAGALKIQGSTTFNTTVMGPFGSGLETETGLQLAVVPNNSRLGLLALFAGESDLAMLSADIKSEVALLRQSDPDLPFERLHVFEIARSHVAFVVHPDNPVRSLPLEAIRKILTGEVTDWKEFGGADLPIRVVTVKQGGGVLATVETRLFGSGHLSAPDVLRFRIGAQILTVVAQERGAIGLSQSTLVQERQATELVVDPPIEQVLSLVSLGDPPDDVVRLVEAMRRKFRVGE